MLTEIAQGVMAHKSEFVQSNAIVVVGRAGVLLIDPGVHGTELTCIADDLLELDQPVAAGFSTHPHWDHLLWHSRFGAAPRYGTATCSDAAREQRSEDMAQAAEAAGIPADVPLELLGLITALPTGTAQIPWDGPRVRIMEHQAHAPGHAALLIEEQGVLVAGDMLSDVLIPLLHTDATADPIESYFAALQLFEEVAGEVDVVVPGHGSIGGTDELKARIQQDRTYVEALRDGEGLSDPRFSTEYSKEWLPGVHARQLQGLTQRSKGEATSA